MGDEASTTSAWEWRKVRQRPKGQVDSPPKAGRSWFCRLPAWPIRRRPLTLTLKYRGGAECWFEVHCRGGTLRRPGHVSLYDLAKDLTNSDL